MAPYSNSQKLGNRFSRASIHNTQLIHNPVIRKFCLALLALSLISTVTEAAPSQSEIAKEINFLTSSATSVVSALQAKINSAGLKPAEVTAALMQSAFQEAFKKVSGNDLTISTDATAVEIRAAMLESFNSVIDKYRNDMIKGGQDSFVPAFFRAQLLTAFNEKAKGKYEAFVSTRKADLINLDTAVDRLIRDQTTLSFVNEWLERGEVEPKSSSSAGRLISYWPMKITEPCANCHLHNGLSQKVGDFGGATIVIVGAAK